MLLALHIALICSTTLSFDMAHFKHKQPQVLSPDSHATIGTIQETQDTTNVPWVWRHNSWHATWPTVVLRFMETRWKTLALSTRNLIRWRKRDFMNNYSWLIKIKTSNVDEYLANWSFSGNWFYAYHSFLEPPSDLEALSLSLHSLLVNPPLTAGNELRFTF